MFYSKKVSKIDERERERERERECVCVCYLQDRCIPVCLDAKKLVGFWISVRENRETVIGRQ